MLGKKRTGFTMIEMLVVVVILGLLATLVVPKVVGQGEEAKRTATMVQIKEIEQALDMFKLDNGFYPSTEQGLRALKEKPSIGRVPQNYPAKGYLDTVPKDPWGRDYVYICPGEHGDFDLISLGADREEGGEGVNADIKSWDLGG